MEHIMNIHDMEGRVMNDFVQDVVSMISMSAFLLAMSVWIGAW
jgi:hypothetical protein